MSFLTAMGRDMGMPPANNETKDHYVERVILSAGAKWMLTAVHNGEGKTSIESIKSVTREKIESYLEIVDYLLPPDVMQVVNYLYDTLLANGMFYHEQFYVRPVQNRTIGIGTVSFIRGLLPDENVRLSGMAPFIPGGGEASLANEFMLWQRDGEETIRSAWNRCAPFDLPAGAGEYLRAVHLEKERYYDIKRHDQAKYTMGRIRKNDGSGVDHYMIQGEETRRFPDDYVKASIHEYVRLAIVNGQRKQRVVAGVGKHLVNLQLGYLLPKPDMRFLKFVSWPESLDQIDKPAFWVCLSPQVWPVVRDRLNFLGFAVEEQHE